MGEEGEGEGEVRWSDGLGADFRGHDLVKQHDSLEGFVKNAVHAQSLIGKKGIIAPDKNSSIEDYASFYEQLGRPRDRDTYAFGDVEFPEGLERDSALETTMLQEFYDSGMSESQAKRVFQRYADTVKDRLASETEKAKENASKLELELRSKFGSSMDVRLEEADKAWVSLLGSEDAAKRMNETKLADGTTLGRNPDLIRAMAELGSRLGEDGLVGAKQPSIAMDPAQAGEKLAAFKADAEKMTALKEKRHPAHDAALGEWLRYQAAVIAAEEGA